MDNKPGLTEKKIEVRHWDEDMWLLTVDGISVGDPISDNLDHKEMSQWISSSMDELIELYINLDSNFEDVRISREEKRRHDSTNGIFKEGKGWYFWDEAGLDKHGPFCCKKESERELDRYVKEALDNTTEVRVQVSNNDFALYAQVANKENVSVSEYFEKIVSESLG